MQLHIRSLYTYDSLYMLAMQLSTAPPIRFNVSGRLAVQLCSSAPDEPCYVISVTSPTLKYWIQLEYIMYESHKFLLTSSLICIILPRSCWFTLHRRVLTSHLRMEYYHVRISYLTGWNIPLRSLSLTICTARNQWIKLIPCLRFSVEQYLRVSQVSINQSIVQ